MIGLALFAATLSLSSPSQYRWSDPGVAGSLSGVGLAVNDNGDMPVRMEDVVFLREAFNERDGIADWFAVLSTNFHAAISPNIITNAVFAQSLRLMAGTSPGDVNPYQWNERTQSGFVSTNFSFFPMQRVPNGESATAHCFPKAEIPRVDFPAALMDRFTSGATLSATSITNLYAELPKFRYMVVTLPIQGEQCINRDIDDAGGENVNWTDGEFNDTYGWYGVRDAYDFGEFVKSAITGYPQTFTNRSVNAASRISYEKSVECGRDSYSGFNPGAYPSGDGQSLVAQTTAAAYTSSTIIAGEENDSWFVSLPAALTAQMGVGVRLHRVAAVFDHSLRQEFYYADGDSPPGTNVAVSAVIPVDAQDIEPERVGDDLRFGFSFAWSSSVLSMLSALLPEYRSNVKSETALLAMVAQPSFPQSSFWEFRIASPDIWHNVQSRHNHGYQRVEFTCTRLVCVFELTFNASAEFN